jgi:hypothetical protein
LGYFNEKLFRKIRIWLCGYVWLNQGEQNENVFLNVLVNRVKDTSLQEWNMHVDDNSS